MRIGVSRHFCSWTFIHHFYSRPSTFCRKLLIGDSSFIFKNPFELHVNNPLCNENSMLKLIKLWISFWFVYQCRHFVFLVNDESRILDEKFFNYKTDGATKRMRVDCNFFNFIGQDSTYRTIFLPVKSWVLFFKFVMKSSTKVCGQFVLRCFDIDVLVILPFGYWPYLTERVLNSFL